MFLCILIWSCSELAAIFNSPLKVEDTTSSTTTYAPSLPSFDVDFAYSLFWSAMVHFMLEWIKNLFWPIWSLGYISCIRYFSFCKDHVGSNHSSDYKIKLSQVKNDAKIYASLRESRDRIYIFIYVYLFGKMNVCTCMHLYLFWLKHGMV